MDLKTGEPQDAGESDFDKKLKEVEAREEEKEEAKPDKKK